MFCTVLPSSFCIYFIIAFVKSYWVADVTTQAWMWRASLVEYLYCPWMCSFAWSSIATAFDYTGRSFCIYCSRQTWFEYYVIVIIVCMRHTLMVLLIPRAHLHHERAASRTWPSWSASCDIISTEQHKIRSVFLWSIFTRPHLHTFHLKPI